jgi:hypothetical protein
MRWVRVAVDSSAANGRPGLSGGGHELGRELRVVSDCLEQVVVISAGDGTHLCRRHNRKTQAGVGKSHVDWRGEVLGEKSLIDWEMWLRCLGL